MKNEIGMKHLLPLFLLFASVSLAYAQSPVPEPDTLKSPVRQTDPTPQTTAPNVDYTQNKVRITSADLPEAVRDVLASGNQYQGWETADAFKDKAGKVYIVEIRDGDRKRVYRFDKTGKPVTDN